MSKKVCRREIKKSEYGVPSGIVLALKTAARFSVGTLCLLPIPVSLISEPI
jgi:hypothetical protein